ncbi:hypothetical protein OVS_03825 [Mycoplasma ovis str. Michigan]|uniref:Uncharacterized protein n=1 Tax=Mycoplasma ovis str. Michigan TaxID=1415773 RepID=A0ABN4BNP2_9MOLU|nr:hypothetical protein OVS_03825 [Mycoplasma ovis str. Michigan]
MELMLGDGNYKNPMNILLKNLESKETHYPSIREGYIFL